MCVCVYVCVLCVQWVVVVSSVMRQRHEKLNEIEQWFSLSNNGERAFCTSCTLVVWRLGLTWLVKCCTCVLMRDAVVCVVKLVVV